MLFCQYFLPSTGFFSTIFCFFRDDRYDSKFWIIRNMRLLVMLFLGRKKVKRSAMRVDVEVFSSITLDDRKKTRVVWIVSRMNICEIIPHAPRFNISFIIRWFSFFFFLFFRKRGNTKRRFFDDYPTTFKYRWKSWDSRESYFDLFPYKYEFILNYSLRWKNDFYSSTMISNYFKQSQKLFPFFDRFDVI